MIILTRLGNGMQIAVNPDLIERAEHTPDTVITLMDGHKLVVEEPLTEVVARVRAWRASVAAEAITLARCIDDSPHTSRLSEKPTAETAIAADRAAHGNPVGRVLRLPSREV